MLVTVFSGCRTKFFSDWIGRLGSNINKKICAQVEKAAPSSSWDFFLGLCTHIAGSTGKNCLDEESRETNGDITSICLQAMTRKKILLQTVLSFLSCPCIFWDCTENKSRSSWEISLTMLKTRSLTQMRFKAWLRTGAAGAHMNHSLRFYVSPMVVFVCKRFHIFHRKEALKRTSLISPKCYWFLNIFWQACCC